MTTFTVCFTPLQAAGFILFLFGTASLFITPTEKPGLERLCALVISLVFLGMGTIFLFH
jgi:hypothetical protein